MSTRVIHVIWLREVRVYAGARAYGGLVTAFLAACGWTFVMALRRGEGSVLQIQSLWGLATALWLPVLSSVLTMRLFAEEHASGMLELLLAAPIRERDVVIGKFLSALTILAVALLLSLLTPVFILPLLSGAIQGNIHAAAFGVTYFVLLLQAATWCAIGVMTAVIFKNQALSAVSALLLCGGLPTGVYFAILAWSPVLRSEMAWMPSLVHVYDFSTGLLSSSVILLYMAITIFCLFVCSKVLACLRLKG